MRVLFLASVTLALWSCSSVENDEAPEQLASLSEPSFRCNVEPILARDCSFAACHGQAGTPLRLYTVGKLRAEAPASLEEQLAPLTDAEHHANFRSALGFTFGGVEADDNLLLRKVLPAAEGGYHHGGGALFSGKTDSRAVAIRAWLEGGTSCTTAHTR